MPFFFLAGRILYGGFFALAGFNHFRDVAMMTPYAAAKGVAAPKVAVLGAGVVALLGGLSILLGYQPTWGVVLLTIFLVPVSFQMHNFWAGADPQAGQQDRVHFMKNIALLGAAWMLLVVPRPWPLSL